jgi:NADH-quinone oxidoreductase subunit H
LRLPSWLPLPFDPQIDAPSRFPTGVREAVSRAPLPGLKLIMAVMTVFGLVSNVAIGIILANGALDGEWYDFRDLGLAIGQLRGGLDDRFDPAVSYVVSAAIGGIVILSVIGLLLVILVWVERRLLARFQVRRGPNRVGPFGLLQPLADAIKMMQKETIIPRGADRFLYFLPPVLVFIPLMLVWGAIPWAPQMTYVDINVGALYLIAVGSLATLAIFLAGWSSNNHYALLGAMRTVAMMISYEIPLSISLLAVVLMAGSMQLSTIVEWQSTHNAWIGLLMPLALFTFFFSSTAELNRTPNDIAEAESEIVAGFHTEYSGMKFGLYLAVELGHAIATGAFVSTLFLGGWSLFGLEEWIPPYVILGVKTAAIYFLLVWLRGTLPRFRLDQLMAFAWKFLIPLAVVNVLVVAVEASIFARWDVAGVIPLAAFAVVNAVLAVVLVRGWSRTMGYRPDAEPLRPVMAQGVGGLRAAQQLRTGS